MSDDAGLVGRGLRYDVAGRTVFEGVDVTAGPGRLFAVSGPSGSGKSSLLALLGGLLAPTAGTVTLGGVPVGTGDDALRRRIAFVPQGYGLVSSLTARQNIAITLQARGVARADVRRRTLEVLEAVRLADVADHLVDELSGGQQHRTAVARALVAETALLVADEPTAELDAENRERMVQLLAARAAAGAVVVLSSDDPEVLERCADVLTLG